MSETPTFEPDRRDHMSHDNLLLVAADRLARAVREFRPDRKYRMRVPEALIVGGYVRDQALGLDPKDADIEVYGVDPERLYALLEKVFGKTKEVGKAFGVIKVPIGDGLELDVSIPRRDSKAGKGHAGILAQSDPSMSVKEAARRRDFTVNTMAMNPLTGERHDPFDGMKDLRSKVLRVTDREQFQEDPLRVLRAVQFVARLEFSVDPESERLMREMVERGDLAELPPDRVTKELEKLLTKAPRPSVGFEFGRRIGLVERLFPEAEALVGVPQEPEWHPEGDVWVHTMMVVDAAAKIARRDGLPLEQARPLMLGALDHDFGKPATTEFLDGRIRSRGHEDAGEAPTRMMCERLTFKQDDVEAAVAIAVNHLKPGTLYRARLSNELDEKQYVNAVRKLVRRLGKTSWRVLLAASEADFRGRTIPGCDVDPYLPGKMLEETVVAHGLDREAAKPLVQGRDLITVFGLKAKDRTGSPIFGTILAAVEAARDDGRVETREQALAFVRDYLYNNPV